MNKILDPKIIHAFWELLRCGLREKAPDPVFFQHFGEKEWLNLFSLAEKQTVTGVCFSAVQKLPPSSMPARSLYLKWYQRTFQVIQHHQHIQQTYCKLQKQFHAVSIAPLILKGIAVARYYPEPSLRMTGDIDLFIPADFHKSVDYIANQGIPLVHSNTHDKFNYDSVSVELHHSAINLPAKANADNTWEDISPITVHDKEYVYETIDVNTTAVLLSVHPFKHLFSWGIGIRHLCDWMLFLEKEHTHIDYPKVIGYLKKNRMERFISAFTAMAVHQLGLEKKIAQPWITAHTQKAERNLCNDMLFTGDIGNEIIDYGVELHKSPFSLQTLSKKSAFYKKILSRFVDLIPVAPYYARRKLLRPSYTIFNSIIKNEPLPVRGRQQQ